jgi:hypothetical protein
VRRIITTLLDLLGAIAVTGGSYVEFGLGWSMIVGGAFVLAISWFLPEQAPEAEPSNDEAWA